MRLIAAVSLGVSLSGFATAGSTVAILDVAHPTIWQQILNLFV